MATQDFITPEDCERAGKSHDFITSEVGTRTFCEVCGGSWAVNPDSGNERLAELERLEERMHSGGPAMTKDEISELEDMR